MNILSIDPASKSCGYAMFRNNELIALGSIKSASYKRITRGSQIIWELVELLKDHRFIPKVLVVEDPLLRGKSNNTMQRFIGALEYSIFTDFYVEEKNIYHIAPTAVKKLMGHGTLDKFQVALSAGDMLKQPFEKELLADKISIEDFDATDAVAIGLTYYLLEGKAND